MTKYTAIFNYLDFELPIEAIKDCSKIGSVDKSVQYWQEKLNLNLNRESMIKELSEYGAWDDLDTCSNNDLEQRLIWIGSCNIREENGGF